MMSRTARLLRSVALLLPLALIIPGARATLPFTFTDIVYPPGYATGTNEINNSGQIVGGYQDANGNNHGFLLVRSLRWPWIIRSYRRRSCRPSDPCRSSL